MTDKEILSDMILHDPIITNGMADVIIRFIKYSNNLNLEYARRMEENYKKALEELRK